MRLLNRLLKQPLQQSSDSWLIVGLGNPGPGYQSNRHNIGQQSLDQLAHDLGTKFKSHKSVAQIAQGRLPGGGKVVLAKSLGYMNLSGSPVQSLMKFFDVPAARVLVIHDELDIPFGDLRLKFSGGHAGHNGLRDIIAKIGNDFHRLRFGIGRPPGNQEVASFVLQNFTSDEKKELPELIAKAIGMLDEAISAPLP